MSERDIKVLLGSAAAMLMVFVIYFVRPIIVKDQEHNLQTQQSLQADDIQTPPADGDKAEAPEITEATEAPEAPEETEQPEITEATETPTTPETTEATEATEVKEEPKTQDTSTPKFRFRNRRLLNEHYEKHGRDMGFASAEEYEKAAAAVPVNPDALHKTEKEDGDDVYYVQATNEFVIVSGDGFIRTYFLPDSGIKYFNKQ